MTRMSAAALALASALCTAALAQEPAAPAGGGAPRVRVLHAVPSAGAVGVKIGDQELFTSVTYRQVTRFRSLPAAEEGASERPITLTSPPGGALAGAGVAHEFDDPDEDYSILLAPRRDGEGVEITVFELDRLKADAQEAQVTLINAVPDVRALDLFVDEDKVHAGVNFQGHNGPDRIRPGPHRLTVRSPDGQALMYPRMVNMRPGQSYTVISMGTLAGGVETVVVEDELGFNGSPETTARPDGPTTIPAERATTAPLPE